jgi:hypothetical protein
MAVEVKTAARNARVVQVFLMVFLSVSLVVGGG